MIAPRTMDCRGAHAMLDCSTDDSFLSGCLDDELTQDNRHRAKRHLETYARCRTTFEATRRLRRAEGQVWFGQRSLVRWSRIAEH